jgi:hypothetical protein
MTVLASGIVHETNLGFVDVENVVRPGKYRFQLTVLDQAKNESEPAFITVTVAEVQRDPRLDPRVDTRVESRIDSRVVLDRRVIDRVVLNPGAGGAVRPTRPIVPRRPGG